MQKSTKLWIKTTERTIENADKKKLHKTLHTANSEIAKHQNHPPGWI